MIIRGLIVFTYLFIWRKFRGLTQRQAADLLALPFLTYRLLETGRCNPTRRDFEALRAHFGARAEHVLMAFAGEHIDG